MLRHIKPGMLVFSVLYILLGLLLLLAPQAVADVFCIALGLLVVLCGLQSLYGYFKKDNGSIRAAVSLLLSLPTIALGMWALLCTVQSAMTFEWLLPLLFGHFARCRLPLNKSRKASILRSTVLPLS